MTNQKRKNQIKSVRLQKKENSGEQKKTTQTTKYSRKQDKIIMKKEQPNSNNVHAVNATVGKYNNVEYNSNKLEI